MFRQTKILAVFAVLATTVQAAVVTTYAPVQIDPNHQTVPSPAVVAAGGTNLASSSQSSFQSLVLSSGIAGGTAPDTKPTGAITVLNDASFGSESSASTAFGASSTGSVITLTFTGGYNLTNIVTTSGCGNSYSQYTTQNYSISLRHHGSTNWTTVVSSLQTGNASGGANNYSNFDPNNSCGGVEQWRSVQVTTSFGSGDATNVDAIRFTLLPTPSTSNGDGSGNGKAVWYREIEVTGTAAGSQSGAPTAAFTGTPLSGTNPLPVAFTDTSSGSPTSWAWTFGDGNTSTAQNPSNTYASTGTYDVRLIACNSNGCTTNTQAAYITVLPPPPVASFTATPTTGEAPLQVIFTDTSTGSPTSWAWTFGDGHTSTAQNPTNTYTAGGMYNVRMIACSVSGCVTNTQTAYIAAYSAAPAAVIVKPVSALATFTSGGNAGHENNWDGNSTSAKMIDNSYLSVGNSGVQTYLNTGDAVPSTPTAVMVAPTGWYGWNAWMSTPNTIGNTVITFDLGQSYSVNSMLLWNYSENGGYGINTSRGLQTLGISYSVDGTNYTSVGTFLFTQSPANDWTPMQTATLEAPVTARYLQVTPISNFGDSWMGLNEVRFTAIVASAAPTANFTAVPRSGVEPLSVIFTDSSTGSPTGWTWDFGDGFANGQNPTNIYMAGTYTVSLVVTNAGGSSTKRNFAYVNVLTAEQSWQNHYGVSLDGADPLGKGISNTDQFLTGFNPTNSAAYPHIISANQSGDDIVITYLGADGDTSYAGGPNSVVNLLEYNAGVGGGSYTNGYIGVIQTNTLTGGVGLGTIVTVTDVGGATNRPARYYRLRVLEPQSLYAGPTEPTSAVTTTWQAPTYVAGAQTELLSPTQTMTNAQVTGNITTVSDTNAVSGTDWAVTVAQGGDVNQSYLRWLTGPVNTGDRLTLQFDALSLDAEGSIDVRVGLTNTAGYAMLDQTVPVSTVWRTYTVCWTSSQTGVAGALDIRLRFGTNTQRLRVRNIQVLTQGQSAVAAVAAPSANWRPIYLSDPDIWPGSALDFSSFWDGQPAGAHGRVIVNAAGHLAFAGNPTQNVRFWGCTVNMGPGGAFSLRHDITGINGDTTRNPLTHADIAAFANRVRNQGYNIFRTHFLDAALMEHATATATPDPVALDNFDYLVYCLKKNGIYLYLDAMTRPSGWSTGDGWSGDGVNRAMRMYWDSAARVNWSAGVTALLTHVNPYTGLALVNDPVVAEVLFCNEEEIDPWGTVTFPPDVLPGFWSWIQTKYATTAALSNAWTDANGVCWLPAGQSLTTVTADNFWGTDPRSRDINRYIHQAETNLLAWYKTTIQNIGYNGLTTQFDCGMRYRDLAVRSKSQALSIHGYAKPLNNWINNGSQQNQQSSIDADGVMNDLCFVRYATDERLADRPFLVTEQDHEFWNPYRHERGLTMAGYAAFQNYDMLVAHAHPVMLSVNRPMAPYFIGADPIGRAAEVLSGLLFLRRDVAPAQNFLTLGIDDNWLFTQMQCAQGMVWQLPQDRLAFVTGFGVTYSNAAGQVAGQVPGATAYSVTNLPSATGILNQLIAAGKVPAANRSNPAQDAWETADGQLFLQQQQAQLQVNTPLTQGATLLAGATLTLPQVGIRQLSTPAAITVSSLDGQPLNASGRMLLIVSTDALNQDMAFATLDHSQLVSIGNGPTLVKTGQFSISLANQNVSNLRVWGLRMNGVRAEFVPTYIEAGQLIVDIDTSTLNQPYLFYEIAQQ